MQNSLRRVVQSPSLLFSLVFVITAAWKLSLLHSRELWLDETYSAFVAHLSFPSMLHLVRGDVHPPLYYILLWLWTRIAGDTETALRLLSVCINLVSVWLLYRLGRRLLSPRFAAFAAALFALSPMLVVYSLEVRSYMLFLLVLIGLLIPHWKLAVEQSHSKRVIAAYILLSALLFYIHYIAVFVLLGLFVHRLVASAATPHRVARLAVPAALTLLLVSPAIVLLLHQHAAKVYLDRCLELSRHDPNALSFGTPPPRSSQLSMASMAKSAASMVGLYPAASPILLALGALPLLVTLAGVPYLWLVKHDQVCRLFTYLAAVFAVGVLALHMSGTRYLLPLIPLLVLSLARVLQDWTQPRTHDVPRYQTRASPWRNPGYLTGAILLLLYTAGFYRQATRQHGRPWNNLVSVVAQNHQPQDQIVFDALYAQVPFDYFAARQHLDIKEAGFPLSVYDWWSRQEMRGWGGPVILQTDLDLFASRLSQSRTTWLVIDDTKYYDPRNALLTRAREIGTVTEVALPPDPDIRTAEDDASPRLFRISPR